MIFDFNDYNDTIFIVPSHLKMMLFKKLNQVSGLKNIKILSDLELHDEVSYQYTNETIFYLYNTYHFKPSIAEMYLKNIQFVDELEESNNPKIQFLISLKQELKKKKLLKKNPYLHNYQQVIVYGFNGFSKELEKDVVKLGLPYRFLEEARAKKPITVYEFVDIEDEVFYVFKEIGNLLKKGVSIQNIKIANADKEYQQCFLKYQSMFQIPFQENRKESILHFLYTKQFLNYLQETNSYELTIEKLQEESIEQEILNEFISVCNQWIFAKPQEVLELIIYQLEKTNLIQPKQQNCVEFIPFYHNIYNEETYVFCVGMNQNILPKVYKDEEYFSNEEKEILGLLTSNEKNKLEKENFQIEIEKNYHLFLSYKLKTPFMRYFKSPFIETFQFKTLPYDYNLEISYSSDYDQILLAKKLDQVFQKTDNEELSLLFSNYKITYKNYHHEYQSISKEKIQQLLKDKNVQLSYSSLNCFYECQFKYYLNFLLSLNKKETTQAIDIGKLFHYVLSKQDQPDFDFDRVYDSYLKDYINNEEKYYVQKLKKVLKDIISINKENLQYTKFQNFLYEKKVVVPFYEPISIPFIGVIDKVMYYEENDKTYAVIIDYKTGKTDIKLDKIQYGLSLQLPTYLYLLQHSNIFKNVVLVGFYLQFLLHSDNTYEELKNNLKLNGYSLDDMQILHKLDSSYEKSNWISSLQVTKENQFHKRAKVLSEKKIQEISKIVEDKIREAICKIAKADFQINPKIYQGKNQSCTYCEFRDCCFADSKDYVYLSKEGEEQ